MIPTPHYFECPACCITLKHKLFNWNNLAVTTHYSDGFIESAENPRPSNLVKCPVCNEVFFYNEHPYTDTYKGTPCVETEYPEIDRWFETLLKYQNPDQIENQLYIRLEIWYIGNHHPIYSNELLNNPELKTKWIDNLDELEKLLNEQNPEQRIIKAEVNRQLGRFSRCLYLLESALTEENTKWVKSLRKKAKKEQTEVFEL